MKKNQLNEIKSKDIKELKFILKDLKKEIDFELVQRASGKSKNVSLVGQKRKTAAVILTIIRQKELKIL